MTPAQWARVLRAGGIAAQPVQGSDARLVVAAALFAMADEADRITRETQ